MEFKYYYISFGVIHLFVQIDGHNYEFLKQYINVSEYTIKDNTWYASRHFQQKRGILTNEMQDKIEGIFIKNINEKNGNS